MLYKNIGYKDIKYELLLYFTLCYLLEIRYSNAYELESSALGFKPVLVLLSSFVFYLWV